MAITVDTYAQEHVVLLPVSWETYQAIATDVGNNRIVRLNYDGTMLEIMSPLSDHEAYTSLIDALLTALMLEWGINLYCTRSSTLQAEPRNAEPDTSYYIEHASQVDGLSTIDLTKSPPPDLVVEVDISNSRMDKLGLYAKLCVPEFWRYRQGTLQAYTLTNGLYVEIAVSMVIPGLPLSDFARFLERRLESDRRSVLLDWQAWLRANRHRNKPKT